MERDRSSALGWGVVLVVAGVIILAAQIFGLPGWIDAERSWPLFIVGMAVVLAVIGVATRSAGMAVPTCIVAGIGLLLYYSNMTGNWTSWAYIWTLIPGFVGVGLILSGILSRSLRGNISGGLWLLLVSAVLFAIFGATLGPWSGSVLLRYWPVALILFGVLLLVEALFRRSRSGGAPGGDRPAR